MPRLGELLSVEPQLKGQAEATRKELRDTFKGKRHLFEEKRTTYRPFQEGAPTKVESQSDIQSTISEELRWLAGIWSKAMDTSYQVAEGNMQARADVVLDNGAVLLRDVPATALLELEKRAGEMKDLLASIPTLDPAKGFRLDAARGADIYKARDLVKPRLAKVAEPIVLYPHSPQHPAQTQLVTLDKPIGEVEEQEWSALLTPADKGKLIERAEELQRTVKAALHRANMIEVARPTCASKVFAFVLDGTA